MPVTCWFSLSLLSQGFWSYLPGIIIMRKMGALRGVVCWDGNIFNEKRSQGDEIKIKIILCFLFIDNIFQTFRTNIDHYMTKLPWTDIIVLM